MEVKGGQDEKQASGSDRKRWDKKIFVKIKIILAAMDLD
jgi:hypothetical protein